MSICKCNPKTPSDLCDACRAEYEQWLCEKADQERESMYALFDQYERLDNFVSSLSVEDREYILDGLKKLETA